MPENPEESLAQRVGRLERINRILIVGLVATCLALLITWGLAAGDARMDSLSARKLIVQELSLVNAAGVEIGSMRPGLDSEADRQVHCVLALGWHGAGVTLESFADGGLVRVNNGDGQCEAAMVANGNLGAAMNMKRSDGNYVNLRAFEDGPSLRLFDGSGPQFRLIGVREEP